ncbi:MAG: hypothetical protein LBJ20_01150 [Candidatus Methanoplasma sp.]|jgi:hypothetical protein|nr:hypothetical protein [Candidatus Methanoplasma sp.]
MKKIIAVFAAIVVVIAAAAAVIVLNSGSENEKGGLYALNAQVISVDMGGISATPKMVESIEDLYGQVYGDYVRTGFTINDAKSDTEFWNKYCDYDSVVASNPDGSYTVRIEIQSGEREITLEAEADAMLSMGTIYMTTVYYYLCHKYSEEPYSDGALGNGDLKEEFQRVIAGGTSLTYVGNQTELGGYFDADQYLDAGQNTIGNYDLEKMGQHVKDLADMGRSVILVGSGKSVSDSSYATIRNVVLTQGGEEAVLVTATDIKDAFANIECLGYILGYGEYANALIEDLQVRLYTVYYSIQQRNQNTEGHSVYWEDYSGSSIRATGMSANIMNFMGWDTSLLTNSEIDTEALLQEKPDIIVFYTNDTRPMDTKMRV